MNPNHPTCETCKYSRFYKGHIDYICSGYICENEIFEKELIKAPLAEDFEFNVPEDFYCKFHEEKEE